MACGLSFPICETGISVELQYFWQAFSVALTVDAGDPSLGKDLGAGKARERGGVLGNGSR